MQHVTLRQIMGWMAWHQEEPRGDRREDIRLALLRADVRGPHVERPESPEDLLPRFRENRPLSPEVDQLLTDFFNLPG